MIAAFQWDLGRQVERLDWLVAQLPRYADWGYRELYLHLEDAVQFPSLPSVARPDAYTTRQFGKLVGAAAKAGIGVVPIVNLLGHTQYLIKVPELRDLNELRAPDGSPLAEGQVCPLHPRTAEVAEALMRDMAPFCTAGKIHVGLDESFSLGRHPLSRAEIAEVGLAGHFGRYVQRLARIASGQHLRLGLWADMLALIPDAVGHLPPGVIAYDWYYYPFRRLPRIELRGFPEYDLAPALRARGVEYWGCPMNGSFRHEPLPVFGERLANIRDWWRRCQSVGAGGMLVTSWEPNRLALPMTTLVDAAAASLWQEPGDDDAASMLAAGFRRAFGAGDARGLARAALSCDERAFVGYARWEIGEHWDSFSGKGGAARFESERSFFSRLACRDALPAAFKLSAAFRLYVAERDAFVRAAAGRVAALRRLHASSDSQLPRKLAAFAAEARDFSLCIRAGRAAARAMWALTRSRRARGPNEVILARDNQRLSALVRWIRQAEGDAGRLAEPSPVFGAWQLSFDILIGEPALQRVVLETRRPGGDWTLVRARTSIEFQARAAAPRARIRREFSAPVDGPGSQYRVSVRGFGRVAICAPELTDGVRALRPKGWKASSRRPIGMRPPATGFPDLDWNRDNGSIVLKFRPAV